MLPPVIQRLIGRILGTPGDSDTGLRREVFEFAARRSDGASIPQPLRSWVDLVANHAYRATDARMDELRQAGYSEGQIFELTIAAAAGAAEMRERRALAALDEALR